VIRKVAAGFRTELLEFPPHCAFGPRPTCLSSTSSSTTTATGQNYHVLFVFPGNPGNPRFYVPMARILRQERPYVGVVLVGFSGHSGDSFSVWETYSVEDQTAMCLGVLREFYTLHHMAEDPSVMVSVAGHSVGAFIAMMAARTQFPFTRIFLLTPTLHGLALSPNGRQRSWMLQPGVRHVIACVLLFFLWLLPRRCLHGLSRRFHHKDCGPEYTEAVASLASHPFIVFNAMRMGHTEMRRMTTLERNFPTTDFVDGVEQVVFYTTPIDQWVPPENIAAYRAEFGRYKSCVFVHDEGNEEGWPHGPIPHDWCTGTATSRRVLEKAVLPYL